MQGGLSIVTLERPSFQCVLDGSQSSRRWRSATKGSREVAPRRQDLMLCGGIRDCMALPSPSLSGDEVNVKCAAQAFPLIYIVSTDLFSSSSSDVVIFISSYFFFKFP